ncbi:cell division protein FtsK [Endozoicomonas montiporae]|uniref:DNA translocase FtsK n=1 Tax=Endozoicomonas montiporae TaxID=1027273 RepID=A0A081NAR0_9GAMM|nr:cell division protein FtsK [Endozoicomonas montiporae]
MRESLNDALALRLREAGMLVLLVMAGFLTAALLTYTSSDPGWSFAGSDADVVNAAGSVGAWFADVLFSLFGLFAWMIPLVLFGKVALVIRYRYETWQWSPSLFAVRFFGMVLALCSGAALAGLYFPELFSLPSSTGGIVGHIILQQFLPVFNAVGSSLLLLAVFITGLTLYTDISWFRVIDLIGRLVIWTLTSCLSYGRRWAIIAYNQLRNALDHWKDRRAEAKARKIQEKEQAKIEDEDKIEPVLEPVALGSKASKEPKVEIQIKPQPAVIVENHPRKERQEALFEELPEGRFPTVGLLDEVANSNGGISQDDLDAVSRLLELKLKDFGVDAEVVAAHPGPVITRYEIQPAPGTKASKISNLAKDLARSLAVISVRVVEVIPGKSVMGIEIPNDDREIVYFSEVVSAKAFDHAKSPLSLALGHDISGQPVVVNLAKMPHLLVAGTTGSGKSVGVNAMILSMLFKAGPEDVRLIMIDPKMLELSIYDGIPHLLAPVVTDMKEAANSLRWCVAEMERRYKLMAALGVRNIAGYNQKVKEARSQGEPLRDPFFEPLSLGGEAPPELETLPFIVVVVDEFADMMMIVGKKVEELIARIAQKARAAGIHLILATQRPSVDVITGLIKANVPTRISFQVSSKIDSRTIIDQGGAEQLLGHGDMLYLPPGTSVPIRVHGAFVSDDEVHRVVADWKKRGSPDYIEDILNGVDAGSSDGSAFSAGLDGDSEQDSLYDEAVAFVTESRRVSISSVQRKFKIGYNRSANIIEAMEQAGVISPAGNNGGREVIAPPPVKN